MPTGRPTLAPPRTLAEHRGKFIRPLVLARYLGTPIRTLYYHIEKGALPVVRRRRTIQIRIEVAREYAAEDQKSA
jgi:hypothetical protein